MRRSPRRSAARHAATEHRIRTALEELAPLLHLDAARLELAAFDAATGVAVLAVEGGCPHCDVSVATFQAGVEAHLQRSVPEVRAIRLAS